MPEPLDLLDRPLTEVLALPMAGQFPGLRPGLHRFDAPGGTLMHAAVADAMAAYLRSEHVANDHGAFPASEFSTRLAEWAGERVRALFGASGGHVVFGPNMTTLTAMFVRSREEELEPGDEIVCTRLNHEANIQPWAAWARRRGAVLRLADITSEGELPLSAVEAAVTPRTRWIAVTGASNALGTACDLAGIGRLARRVGARVFVDGVQLVPHLPVTVEEWGCDAFVASSYKWYGPHCGALWLADGTAAGCELPEQVGSAGQELPGRLDLGTTQFEALLGTGVAAEVLLAWRERGVLADEFRLATRLRRELAANPAVRVLGPADRPPAVPVVSFHVAGLDARESAARLAASGVAVWDGTFYATEAMKAVSPDTPEAVRAGVAAYTTDEDVTALVEAVARLTGGRS